ncbi:hypothetical protein Droror1_Dr00025556 [Drosera rotundifolia]
MEQHTGPVPAETGDCTKIQRLQGIWSFNGFVRMAWCGDADSTMFGFRSLLSLEFVVIVGLSNMNCCCPVRGMIVQTLGALDALWDPSFAVNKSSTKVVCC